MGISFDISSSSTHLAIGLTGLLLVILGAQRWLATRQSASLNSRRLPPEPARLTGTPISAHPWLDFAKWSQSYGDVLMDRHGDQVTIVLTSAEAISAVEKRSGIYSDRPRLIMAWELGSNGNGITLTGAGPLFRKHRKVFNAAFNKSMVPSYDPAIKRGVNALVSSWLEHPEDFHSSGQLFSASLMSDIVYGRRITTHYDPEIMELKECNDTFFRLTLGSLVDRYPVLLRLPRFISPWKQQGWRFFQREYSLFRRQLLAAQKLSSESSTVPLLAHQVLKCQEEHGLTDEQAAYLAGSQLGAGTETIAQALNVTMMALAKHPHVLLRAQEEVDAALSEVPTPADLPRLPYCAAIVQESLRWRPMVAFGAPHRLTEDDEFRGFHLPAGATIFANAFAANHDPVVWKDPGVYEPARHLPDSTLRKLDSITQRRTVFSFGFARRICPGEHLALRALHLLIATLVWSFDIKEGSTPIDSDPRTGFGGGTAGSLPHPFACVIEPRAKSRDQLKDLYL